MVAFWSSFAPAALITSIKNDLKLTKGQIADANVAAVMGGVVARLFIGKFMDSWGPRWAFILCLWGTAPAVFGISKVSWYGERRVRGVLTAAVFFFPQPLFDNLPPFLPPQVTSFAGYAACRFFIAFSLAAGELCVEREKAKEEASDLTAPFF